MQTILDAIGNTPLLNIEGIWVKMEYLNPSGSIKARIAKYIIERAEQEGLLHSGDTIVEASSGNTGNAMSMVAAVKGYKMLVVTPHGLSQERIAISKAFGAEVRTMGEFHVNQALAEAHRLGDLDGYFCPDQFGNEWNVQENREWLGQEILAQLVDVPDVVVNGVGTGGTIIGVGQAFKAVNPICKVIALEPSESCTIMCGEVCTHKIEGISDGFIPEVIKRHIDEIDGYIDVPSELAVAEMRRLASEFGIFVGPSSGAHLLAAKRLKSQYAAKTVVTFFCDEGEKYMNEYWIS